MKAILLGHPQENGHSAPRSNSNDRYFSLGFLQQYRLCRYHRYMNHSHVWAEDWNRSIIFRNAPPPLRIPLQ